MSWLDAVILIVSGIFVGFINTLAGGGTIISLMLFMYMGLPINVANGTNRIAVIFQNMTSTYNFHQKKLLPVKKAFTLAIPALLGSVLGAQLAIDINPNIFKKGIGVAMLVMAFFMLMKPTTMLQGNKALQEKKISWLTMFYFFFVGLYGGLFQVGVGYLLVMGVVVGLGYNLIQANAFKVFIVLMYTVFALFVFVFNGAVVWRIGLVHSIGNIIGAYIASHLAIEKGVGFVRWFMIVIIVLLSGQMLGLYDIASLLHFLFD